MFADNPLLNQVWSNQLVDSSWEDHVLVSMKLEHESETDSDDPSATTWIKTLSPRSELEESGLIVGSEVFINKPEMSARGFAVITKIESAPPIQSGDGEIVTSTFRHTGGQVFDVKFEGEKSSVGVTATHPFWSPKRRDFVPIGEMEVGDLVQTYSGETKRIVSKLARPGPQVVYNIEVANQHVYYVGEQGILVHNMSKILRRLETMPQGVQRRPRVSLDAPRMSSLEALTVKLVQVLGVMGLPTKCYESIRL